MSEAVQHSEQVPDGYEKVQFGPKTLLVPTDWETPRFGEVFKRRKESIDAEDGETIRYVGLKNIDSGELCLNGYDESGRERSSSRAFREGDVLFGKLRPNLEKAAIAPFDGICSSDIIPIYAEDETLNQYLPYLMHSKLIRDRVVSTMEGTNLPRTSWGDLESTRIPLPSKNEQRRIVDILSTVDEQIQQTDDLIDETKKLKRGLIQDLFLSGFDRHQQYQNVSLGPKSLQIPQSWSTTSINDVTKVVTDGTHSSPKTRETGRPYLTSKNIRPYGFDLSDMKYVSEEDFKKINSRCEPKKGDVLYVKDGANTGIAQVNSLDFEFCLLSSVALIRPNELLSASFLRHQLSWDLFKQIMISRMSGTGIKRLTIGKIKKSEILLPPIDEQKRIADVLNTIDEQITEERERKHELQELKRGLMQDLLTGQRRVDA